MRVRWVDGRVAEKREVRIRGGLPPVTHTKSIHEWLMTSLQPDCEALLRHVARRWSRFADLGRSDVEAVERLAEEATVHPRGADLGPEPGEAPQIVVAGWACHMRPLARRARQIFGFLLPGDAIGSFWRPPEYVFHRTVALTRLQLVSTRSLLAVEADGAFRRPALVAAARRAEDHAQHLLLNHITRLGARDAYSGLAHLLVELHDRLDRVGLACEGEFRLPIGQRVLAQTMGFSLAHTNHTLQRMAEDGLFEAKDDVLRLLQPEKMAELADFQVEDPAEVEQPGEAASRRSSMDGGACRRGLHPAKATHGSAAGRCATMSLAES